MRSQEDSSSPYPRMVPQHHHLLAHGRALPVAVAMFVAGMAMGTVLSGSWFGTRAGGGELAVLSRIAHVPTLPVRRDDESACSDGCSLPAPSLPRPDLIEPEWQSFCASVMEETTARGAKGAQFQQDLFLFGNFFSSLKWGEGVFVDIGANHYSDLSNTLFFEKCLGWKGVCVEPQKQYRDGFRTHRKGCHLMENCVWSEKKLMRFDEGAGTGAAATEGSSGSDASAGAYQCETIDTVLDKAKELYGVDRINLVSLDVEGAEVRSLSTYSFGKGKGKPLIDTWIVENFWSAYRDLDFAFTLNGFVKRYQLPIDAVYSSAGSIGAPILSSSSCAGGVLGPFKPKSFVSAWNLHQEYARGVIAAFAKGNVPSFVLVDQCTLEEGRWA
jgi:FkbM family methyltransferase